jgi:hypothetical protein
MQFFFTSGEICFFRGGFSISERKMETSGNLCEIIVLVWSLTKAFAKFPSGIKAKVYCFVWNSFNQLQNRSQIYIHMYVPSMRLNK